MKKVITLIYLVLLAITLTSCGEKTVYISIYDVKSVLRQKYDIHELLTIGTRVKTIDFPIVEGNNVDQVIASYKKDYDPKGNYEGHSFFMAIGKTWEGEYKFVYYNLTLKKGYDKWSAVGISDYSFSFTLAEIDEKVASLSNAYYQDLINAILRSGELVTSEIISDKLVLKINQYRNVDLTFTEKAVDYEIEIANDEELVITLKQFNREMKMFEEVYNSTHDEKIQKIAITKDNYSDYFDILVSYEFIENISDLQQLLFLLEIKVEQDIIKWKINMNYRITLEYYYDGQVDNLSYSYTKTRIMDKEISHILQFPKIDYVTKYGIGIYNMNGIIYVKGD